MRREKALNICSRANHLRMRIRRSGICILRLCFRICNVFHLHSAVLVVVAVG